MIQAESQGSLGLKTNKKCVAGTPLNETHEIVPGVAFGRPEWVLSPAYWAALVEQSPGNFDHFEQPTSLKTEVCFCLLGGHGITAEVNCAAYQRLESAGLFDSDEIPPEQIIEELLRAPLSIGDRTVRYRFPRQRAQRISRALQRINNEAPPEGGSSSLREYLLRIEGIGPKTASWIARNWLRCDEVAILDIHVLRAGLKIGLFGPKERLPRDYFSMEQKFLSFAQALGVKASTLDMAIWSTMRNLGRIAYS